jgi:sulfur carrier protein
METADSSISVNGEPWRIRRGATVYEVLADSGLDPDEVRGVAVAVNDEVVRRESWATTVVRDGDRLEIVTARQGG